MAIEFILTHENFHTLKFFPEIELKTLCYCTFQKKLNHLLYCYKFLRFLSIQTISNVFAASEVIFIHISRVMYLNLLIIIILSFKSLKNV